MRNFSRLLILLLGLLISVQSVSAQTTGITSPTPGQIISDVVIVSGTADSVDFLRYELAFLRDEAAGTGWIVFADGDQPVIDNTLAVWDTTVGQNVNAPVFPDGSYQLRLRVVHSDFNFDEIFVSNLIIENGTSAEVPTQPPPPPPPTETPSSTEATPPAEAIPPTSAVLTETVVTEGTELPPTETPTAVPTATPLPIRNAPTAIPTIILQPTLEAPPEVLPTLTAFPTPTPAATADQTAFTLAIPEGDGSEEIAVEGINGAVETLISYDYSLFGTAMRRGFRWTFILFAAIGFYLAVRWGVRWVWETISSNW